jgi:TonB-dependent starch-binding outer membrane protein SusC
MRNQRLLLFLTRHALSFSFFFFIYLSIAAQKQVTGVVKENNIPVVGATVEVKGTNVATITGFDGGFIITLPEGKNIIVISYVGLETQTINVGDKTQLDVVMVQRNTTLNEVVVTGYSSQAKKDITGSVAVVKVADLKSVPSANAETQLQGRASGVTVVTDNRPGVGSKVRIRGFSSFGDNDPLYIIDGVPAGRLDGLNPNDIESMQVLKDAASASVYGARASNGVIIVTTKKGRQGSAKVSYNMYYGSQAPGKGLDLLNSQEMANLTWLAYQNAGQAVPTNQYGTGSTPVLPDYILPAGKFEGDPAVNPALYNLDLDNVGGSYLIVKANKAGTNWYDEITDNAPIMNHNISLSGSADRSRYLMSFDYFDQKSIIVYSFFRRYTMRLNTEFNVKKNIRIGENVQLRINDDNTVGNNGNNGEGTELGMGYRNQPIIPVYDIMGNWGGSRAPGLGNASNPVAQRFRAKDNRGQNINVFGNMYAEVDFLKHLTARTSFGGQFNSNNFFFFNFKTYENSENNTGNSYTEGFARFREWVWTNQLTYKNTFGGVHDLNVLLGTEAVEGWGRNVQGTRVNYFIEALNFWALSSGGAAGQQANGSPFTPSALNSYFGKVDYSWKNTILGSATMRRDGSSRFGPENRWGNFPAVSLGWRVTEHAFMDNVRWVTDLKLRGSYGRMGNQRINPANAFNIYVGGPGSSAYDINGTSNSTAQGFQQSFVGNPAGKWETNITKNFGFDATLFGGKTELIVEWYHKKTEDLLFRLPALATAGAGAASNPAFYNVAKMINKGVDLLITHRGDFGGKNGVQFDATLAFTTYKNRITELAEGLDFYDTRGSRIGNWIRNQIGHEMSSYYGYQVVGLFQSPADVAASPTQDAAAPGRFKYQDTDGDGAITPADRIFLGSPNPAFSYGLNLNGALKGLDVSMFFYGAQGKEIMNYVKWWVDFFPSFQGNKSKDALYNSWSSTKTDAKVPIAENASNFSNNSAVSSYYLEDGSYFRMKNLTIGYTLPTSLISKWKIDKLRIYVQGTNLFTITKYSGLDPELIGADDSFGVDEGILPTVRQFLVGLNLNF